MTTLQGLLLGIINIAIVIAILLLIGAIVMWFCSWMTMAIPANVQKGYIAVVALIGLYMLVALLFGIPTIRVIALPDDLEHHVALSPLSAVWGESELQRTARIAHDMTITSRAAIMRRQ